MAGCCRRCLCVPDSLKFDPLSLMCPLVGFTDLIASILCRFSATSIPPLPYHHVLHKDRGKGHHQRAQCPLFQPVFLQSTQDVVQPRSLAARTKISSCNSTILRTA